MSNQDSSPWKSLPRWIEAKGSHALCLRQLFWALPAACYSPGSEEDMLLRRHAHLDPEPIPLHSALMALSLLPGPEEALSLSILSVTDSTACVGTVLSCGYEVAFGEDGQNLNVDMWL